MFENNDNDLDLIEAYDAVDDLEVNDPVDEIDDKVEDEYEDNLPLSMLMYSLGADLLCSQ